MRKVVLIVLAASIVFSASPAFAQVKMTREQMMFYTSDWKGDRFPDGRPKVPDDLLKRALDRLDRGRLGLSARTRIRNQFEGGWQALHIEKPFAGRALTAQYMPLRPDMARADRRRGQSRRTRQREQQLAHQ